MKKYLPVFAMLALFTTCQAQYYSVGVQSVTWTDSSRSNRSVPVEFHYPGNSSAIAADSFGFVVFGHGFDIPISAYYNYADSLAAHGYIVALTSNEGGLLPNHTNLANDLIFIYNTMIYKGHNDNTSLLYNHVKAKGSIAGHSMGGGCAVLSCQFSDTATCYWTLSEATTVPSSITAATYMTKPYLSFAGSSDCIAPPSTNQIPTYDSSRSVCKTFVEIANATHCQFASNNGICVLGEVLTGCSSTSLSLAGQTDTALKYIYPFLDYYLNGNCQALTQFETIYNADVNDTRMQSCSNNIPTGAAITGNSSFCNGNTAVLTAFPAGFYYSWSNGASTSTINVTSPGTYTLTVSNSACAIVADSFVLNENPSPKAKITAAGSTTFCEGNSVKLTAGAGKGYKYFWSNNATTQSINASASGEYEVSVSNSYGCGKKSQAVKVIVNPVPAAAIAVSKNTLCKNGSAVLTTTAGNGYKYLWSTGAQSRADTIKAVGEYAVTVTNKYACSVMSDTMLSCNEIASKTNYDLSNNTAVSGSSLTAKIYPNPCKEQFSIVIQTSIADDITIKLFDMQGSTIELRQNCSLNEVVDCGSYASGIYIVQIQQGENIRELKLVKL
jgi:hypothetical protein